MAPAAASTIGGIMNDLKCELSDFDKVVTGELGHVGSDILYNISKKIGAVDI